MAETHEPRALSAALAAPAFATRGAGLAMHVADRHVERWAPESGAGRVRPMRSLGFVDRLIAPWIETAQRSASLRLFGQYTSTGFSERAPGSVSWVFPRPWYQDELDWMAAARRRSSGESELFTTRGTYVASASAQARVAASAAAMPPALYEFVAPSMSIAAPSAGSAAIGGVGYGGSEAVHADAYSPLIPLAAVQAAQLMNRAVAPALAPATSRMSPALRSVLSTMLERAALSEAPTRLASYAPDLVTPPAPRAPEAGVVGAGAGAGAGAGSPTESAAPGIAPSSAAAEQVIAQYAAQRARIVELQRLAQKAAERELVARAAEAQAKAAAPATAPSAPSTAAGEARAAEIREAARRSEAQLREAATARTEEQRVRVEAERASAMSAERARLEERIAQRVAERAAAQHLHEQARSEAAAHARTPLASPQAAAEERASAAERREHRAPAEVTSAIASLPPELAAFLGQRPERVMQAIDELDVALRTVELIARGAASGAAFEATRGPRLVMPAGLGGLVSAVDRARAIGEPQPQLGAFATGAMAPAAGVAAPGAVAGAPARSAIAAASRVPSLPWLATARPIGQAAGAISGPVAGAGAASTSSALGATAAAAPASLSHVAWADRWLARFAGASKASLDTLAVGGPGFQALAASAPGNVFVSPTFFDVERDASPASEHRRIAALAERRPTLIQPPAPVIRYADDAETPDDVFADISAAVTRRRAQPVAATATAAATAAAERRVEIADRTPADVIAASAPAAPNAGLSAQLASSPFAPAIRHVMPMPSAVSFDVRSLFGGGLSATYLAGLLAADSRELELASSSLPAWAASSAGLGTGIGTLGELASEFATERAAPSWDATYVAPDAGDLGADRDALAEGDATAHAAPSSAYAGAAPSASSSTSFEQASAAMAPLTTLRAALLSWSAEVPAAAAASAPSAAADTAMPSAAALASIANLPVSTARAMLESMSLPMLGDVIGTEERDGAWMAPGMIASRAHSWSVAQERSASDLALDFVGPELVLAARVYGLGPSEAAQAARLAIAGSGHLTAMAGAVDRTFLQAMAMDSARRERIATLTTAYPTSATSATSAMSADAAAGAPASSAAAPSSAAASAIAASAERPETGRPGDALAATSGTAFGVDRRAPRGAFLWPSASVAALGLNAAVPEGQQAMSVAALELLAARSVAELGTFAVLDDASLDEVARSTGAGAPGRASGALEAGGSDAATAAFASLAAQRTLVEGGSAPASLGEPAERDVLAAANELVPSTRRARFDALYVALGQTTAGRSWSPAARAARALALAGQTDDAPVSARERAASAWDVLPVVYASEGLFDGASIGADGTLVSAGASSAAARGATGLAARAASAPGGEWVGGYAGAGLSALSARAGEALGSYVAPAAAPARSESSSYSSSSSSSSDRSEAGAVLRPPTAMQELVRTGRPAGRYGGGEVEIPPWFEAAARKMFESQGSTSDISLAELTLVTAAPSTHIAASTRSAPSTVAVAPPTPSGAGGEKGGADGNIDVESLANEIYRQILVMMDAARARNGEPYL